MVRLDNQNQAGSGRVCGGNVIFAVRGHGPVSPDSPTAAPPLSFVEFTDVVYNLAIVGQIAQWNQLSRALHLSYDMEGLGNRGG